MSLLQFIATVELLVCWFAWGYPFIFRAPRRQQRPSVTLAAPTRWGLLLECIGIVIAWVFRLPAGSDPAAARFVTAMLLGPLAGVAAWFAVQHLGRQFRVNAGLYEDHELIRTGPYAIVRHPIYSSLLALLLATLLTLTPWKWILVSLAFYVTGTEIRVRAEDQLLASRFGDEFKQYKASVSAYIPFVR